MPRTLRQGLLAAATFIVLALSGCAVDPPPPVRYYRLEVPAPQKAGDFAGRIVVEPFEAYGINNERAIVFRARESTSALEQYHYAFWAETPSVTLRDSLVAYLRAAFPQAQVIPAGGRSRGDFMVRPRLKRLEHVLGAPSQAALALEFRVTDANDEDRVLTRFEETAPTNGASVEDFVAATDQLLANACADLVQRMRDPLAAPAAPAAKR